MFKKNWETGEKQIFREVDDDDINRAAAEAEFAAHLSRVCLAGCPHCEAEQELDK
jgi:hypothetical protein